MIFFPKLLTFAPLVLLIACGGGGSQGGGASTPIPSPVAGAPVATDAATLVAWTRDGGRTAEFENGVMRTRRTLTVDGVRHSAYVDAVPGYGDARVTYTDGSGETVFALVDNAAPTGTAPTGVYTGEVDAVWTPSAGIGAQSGTGRMAITLDAASGEAWIDSIIGGTNSNVQFMGAAKASGGRLSADDLTAQYRDGEGYFIRNEEAVVDGRLIAGHDTAAIIGTIGADSASAGFTTGLHPEHAAELTAGQAADL